MIERLHIHETILITAGLLFLVSTAVIAGGGDFIFNIIAKGLYVVGVIMFVLTQ